VTQPAPFESATASDRASPDRAEVERPRADRAEVERFLFDALDRAAREGAIGVVRVPAPHAALEAPLHALRKGTSIAWRPPAGPAVAGHGEAARLELEGPRRFAALEGASDAIFGRMLRLTHPSVRERAPRLFGGWAFAEGSADDEPWGGFGDGRFVLPRWSYEPDGAGAALTLAIDLSAGWAGRQPLVRAELGTLWEGLFARRREPPAPRVVRVEHVARERWRAQIEAITDAIHRGDALKIVAARRAALRTDTDLDPWRVLRSLSDRHPSTWRFGLRFGVGTFLAATPERLFVKRGRALETDALAGSIGSAEPDAAERLRASVKDRREHRPVVAHLLERIAPLCEQLDPPGEPRVRRLPDVSHLHTPLRGVLRRGVHAAEVAAALHPTPAVGGVPVAEATRWITAHEPHRRGWYCGPVGWIDADGDAEITVALRSGVVRGANAWLWAGGGIVEGSDPDAEWSESALKLRALASAIGASTGSEG
jgi:menaquinone-specific isochorismate synthase